MNTVLLSRIDGYGSQKTQKALRVSYLTDVFFILSLNDWFVFDVIIHIILIFKRLMILFSNERKISKNLNFLKIFLSLHLMLFKF